MNRLNSEHHWSIVALEQLLCNRSKDFSYICVFNGTVNDYQCFIAGTQKRCNKICAFSGQSNVSCIDRCSEVTDVSCLGSLKSLTLVDCVRVKDVSPLRNIHSLKIIRCGGITDITALTNNYSLMIISCSIHTVPETMQLVKLVSRLPLSLFANIFFPKLRWLEVSTAASITNLLHVSKIEFDQLFQVHLKFCDKLTSPEGLKKVRLCRWNPVISSRTSPPWVRIK
jgi:hypothetical protein